MHTRVGSKKKKTGEGNATNAALGESTQEQDNYPTLTKGSIAASKHCQLRTFVIPAREDGYFHCSDCTV